MALFDQLQQVGQISVYVGLSHLKGQPFIKGVTKQEAVNESGIDARHADDTATPYCGNTLTQRFTAAAFQFEIGEHGFGHAAFCLESYCINYRIHTAIAGAVFDNPAGRVIDLIEVNRDNTVALAGKV